jgi:hypothetical protein
LAWVKIAICNAKVNEDPVAAIAIRDGVEMPGRGIAATEGF